MDGAAVLMEFNSWNNWLNAATLGAQQVIFIEPDTTSYSEAEQKFLQVPNSVERFWIDRESGRRLQRLLAARGETDELGRHGGEREQDCAADQHRPSCA